MQPGIWFSLLVAQACLFYFILFFDRQHNLLIKLDKGTSSWGRGEGTPTKIKEMQTPVRSKPKKHPLAKPKHLKPSPRRAFPILQFTIKPKKDQNPRELHCQPLTHPPSTSCSHQMPSPAMQPYPPTPITVRLKPDPPNSGNRRVKQKRRKTDETMFALFVVLTQSSYNFQVINLSHYPFWILKMLQFMLPRFTLANGQ